MERSAVSTTAELLVELINDGENGPTVGRTDRHADGERCIIKKCNMSVKQRKFTTRAPDVGNRLCI